MTERTATITAAELSPGVVVHYNKQTSWEILSLEFSGSTVAARFRYVSCEFEPARVGTEWAHTFRASTKLNVTA